MRFASPIRSKLLAFSLAALVSTAGFAADGADPLEAVLGRWRGTVGTPENNSDWGIEIKRDDRGVVHGYIHHNLINFFGLDGGEVRFVDGEYELPPFGWRAKLVDGKLVGRESGPLKINLDLARTDTLPADRATA